MVHGMRIRAIQSLLFVVCAACGGRTVSEHDTNTGAGGTGGAGGAGGAGGTSDASIVDVRADFAGLSCEEQTKLASKAINDAVMEAQKDLSCASSADCLTIGLTASCYSACFTWVNTAGAKLIHDTIDDLDATVCSTFKSKGCMIAVPPCVAPMPPVCLSGKCTPVR
jgi:hypothetical protein